MTIFSLRPRAFRTRNPGRDEETDIARFETVRNAIAMALADAGRERDGLLQRMDAHFAQAASMLDDSVEYRHRASSEETAIRSAEQNAINARNRLRQLDAQMAKFNAILEVLNTEAVSASAPAAPNSSVA